MSLLPPRPTMRASTFLSLLLFAAPCLATATSAASGTRPTPDAASRAWMQAAADSWEQICRDQLDLPLEPLPWLIFYDDRHSFHVNADPDRVRNAAETGVALHYHGRDYPIIAVPHDEQGRLSVPDRSPLSARQTRIFTAPYDGARKSVVVCALPVIARTALPDLPAEEFAEFLLGILGHEMAHTRQVAAVDARFKAVGERYRLPESFDDNVVEKTFAHDPAYVALFQRELDEFAHAAFPDGGPDDARRRLRQALALARERHAKYFTGPHAALGELDDVYLGMEGIGQWVHFQVLRRTAPAGETAQQTAERFLRYTGTSWVQAEGFFLILCLDRDVPGWQRKFFAADLPSPFTVLEQMVARADKP